MPHQGEILGLVSKTTALREQHKAVLIQSNPLPQLITVLILPISFSCLLVHNTYIQLWPWHLSLFESFPSLLYLHLHSACN